MAKNKKKPALQEELTDLEKRELEAILDRVSVQSPDGESFQNWVNSLKTAFSQRQRFLAALLDALSRSPTEAGLRVFNALKDCVTDKNLRRVIKTAEYRLEQKGLLKKEATPETVVIFSEKTLESKALESSEAHLWLFPVCGRVCVSLYVPSPALDNYCLLIGSDFTRWASFMIGKIYDPDNTFQCTVLSGGKKVYKEITSNLDGIPHVVSAPVSLPFAALCAEELIKVFLKSRRDIVCPPDLAWGRTIISPFIADPDLETSLRKELNISTSDISDDEQTEIPALLESLGSFWAHSDEMMKLVGNLLEVVNSVLTWDRESKVYHVRRKILEFVNSLDDFYKGLYLQYLMANAVVQGIRFGNKAMAKTILNIASNFKDGNYDRWEDFIVLHLCGAILNFIKLFKFRDEIIKEMIRKNSDLIVVPEIKTSYPELDNLSEFLADMLTMRR